MSTGRGCAAGCKRQPNLHRRIDLRSFARYSGGLALPLTGQPFGRSCGVAVFDKGTTLACALRLAAKHHRDAES